MVEVVRSTVIDAPVEAVWAVLRDFNGHESWHPPVAASRIEAGRGGTEVGAVRNFVLGSGERLREQLLELDDLGMTLRYCILDAPLPLYGYVATIRLKRVTDGDRCFWEWRSRFAAPEGEAEVLAALVGDEIYGAGFAAIRERLARGRRASPAGRSAARLVHAGPMPARAISLLRHGGPEELRLVGTTVMPPGPGQVRIRQTAIGVNYIDVYIRSGAYQMLTLPGTPGMEAAGEVIDVGEGVIGIMPGDRVAYASAAPGAYASVRTMPADQLVVLPPEIDDEVAAAAMLKGMTAEYLLHRTHRVRSGETVLVHAAAGATGLLLCQWAKKLGATVIGTVSSEDKARLARAAGCDYPLIPARDGGFAGPVRELTRGQGCNVIYDGIGRDSFADSLEALATCGHLVSYGQASGALAPIDPALLSRKSATLTRPVLFHYVATPQALREVARNLFAALRDFLQVEIRQRYPLAEAARAHRELESRRTVGASILLP
jgi:NADPH2:quinone reductase